MQRAHQAIAIMGQKRKRVNADTTVESVTVPGKSIKALAAERKKRKNDKRKRQKRVEDEGGDAPKSFLRLINQKRQVEEVKKNEIDNESWKTTRSEVASKLLLQPGEKMSDFKRYRIT